MEMAVLALVAAVGGYVLGHTAATSPDKLAERGESLIGKAVEQTKARASGASPAKGEPGGRPSWGAEDDLG